MPGFDIVVVLVVLSLVVLALMFLRGGPDLVLMGGLTILLLAGVVSPEAALKGFANKGLITVALLFVVAEGLRQTGAINFIGNSLGTPHGLRSAQMRIMFPTAVLSSFLNNTPVVAMMMPVIDDWAKKHRLSVSHLLMPLSYAAILGGMCTLVGTSTTLVVNGLLIDEGFGSLGMFELAWVGIPCLIVGGIYLLFCAQWLLAERRPAFEKFDDPREYIVEMLVEPNSPFVGKTIQDAGLRQLPGMYLMEIDRDGHVLAAVSSSELLQKNDRLVFVGIVDSVRDLQKIPGLTPATNQVFKLDSPREDRCLIEAVVSNSFPFLHMTIRDARFRTHYNAAVVAVARNGERLRKKIGDIELQPGDTLLLEAHQSFLRSQRNSRDFFLVSAVENSNPPRHDKVWFARGILGIMVITVAVGMFTMLKAAMLAAGLMIVTRCCRGSQARASVDLGVLLTIAAGLGLGNAMEVSGAAAWISRGLIDAAGPRPWIVLAVIYGITMIFTNLITAKAAAVLVFPIAIASAKSLDISAIPLTIAVIMAAAASFATPIGYQTNLMVYGPGGYRFSDYLKLGGILSLLLWGVSVAVIPFVWKF